mmetsp:Transcript_6108/g.20213  ORF Transcript_6108/g.20213 Transcript_6108/m.20213 type:complete len:85 (+) Transcript_6108:398-652(+)
MMRRNQFVGPRKTNYTQTIPSVSGTNLETTGLGDSTNTFVWAIALISELESRNLNTRNRSDGDLPGHLDWGQLLQSALNHHGSS